MSERKFFKKPSKEGLYRYRWHIALMNLIQPRLGFALYGKWIDTAFTFISYIAGFYMTLETLSDPYSDNWQIYIAVGLVSMSFIYSIVKPILIISPYKKGGEPSPEQTKRNQRVAGGIDRFWLLQFLNRLWPGLGLMVTRYWHIGLAVVLLGIGVYIVPSMLWPENQMWIRKILFILTYGAGFLVTLSIYGYGGMERTRTWIAVIALAILSLFNIRYTDMVRENFVFIPIAEPPGEPFDIRTGDFVVAKTTESDETFEIGELVVCGDNNYREHAELKPYRTDLPKDSIFARAIKVIFPYERPLRNPELNHDSKILPVSHAR